ncbi:sugar phosphate isomerase/epimerase [Haloferula helveola]|uniref:Sugar phosphate isomerase/epimerase n=1 Tax=Haloferula helveola TaxID=490095 RepID=A0ABN6H481_9BACT|nr:sugar phosphate isomerase/epimerase [Haloferula helveola]
MKSGFAIALALSLATTSHAGVTYVDATLANTDNASGGGDATWADGDDGTTGGTVADGSATNDGLWRFRSAQGNGGIWEATSGSAVAEDCAEIAVSVAVPNELYNVYVFYYPVTTSGDFPIRAGFSPSPNTNPIFDRAGAKGTAGQDAATLSFDVAPPSGGESRTLLYGLIGQVEVTDGSLEVFIDDFPASSTGTSNDRTWFAGIGYEVGTPPPAPDPPDQIEGTLISIDPDAAWTWYTDERAIIDFPRLIAGGVRGKDWFGSVGDIVGTQFDLTTGQRTPFLLGPPPIKEPSNIGSGDTAEDKDDHNTAAFIRLPDGHYVSAWSSHSENNEIHIRRSTNPGDATAWDPEQIYERSVADGASEPNDVTYHNLIYLSAEGTGQGRLYNFFRNDLADSWDRWFIYSDDLGVTWNWGGRHTGQDDPEIRPYPKYATNGVDTIWWISSEDNSGQNIWSGYIKDGGNHKMDGSIVDADIFDNSASPVGSYTSVMMSGDLDDGTSMEELWPRDLEYDAAGNLAGTWRANGNGSSTDLRQFYGHWDPVGGTWIVNRLCFTGDFSVTLQQDGSTPHRGTPLSAINPKNANVCFFSANADPATGAPLVSQADGRRNFEIFRAETSDSGATWQYTQITRDSSCHNFRVSVVPWDEDNTCVMWMRGYYDRWFFNANNNGWDCALVAWLDRPSESSAPLLHYTDADLTNTTLADGSPLTTYTTSSSSAGADDNQWHLRTNPSLGNNGTIFTANESVPYAEDCPVLKTTVPGVAPGTYDVFACFWSLSNDDFDLMAGLTEDSLAFFQRKSSQHAPASEFDTTVLDSESSRRLYRGYVGRVTLPAAGSVEVFVDQFANDADTNSRTWYDGIALQQVGSDDDDSDSDGQADSDEVVAGTDAFDGGDFFAIDTFSEPDGGPVDLDLSGKAGRIYQLWRSTDLITWTPVGPATDPLAADGPVSLSDPSPPAVRAFYRASVSLP